MNLNDPKNVLGSTEMFAEQCRQIWEDVEKVQFPEDYKNIKNIVFCGMGGSAYGGYVVSSLFKDTLKVPLISNNDYHLPGFVDNGSLVFLSSYSGSTEETLSCLKEAKEKGLKITGATTGGKLGEAFNLESILGIIFDPKFNPSGQPRLGAGYMVLGALAILNKLGVLNLSDDEVKKAISKLEKKKEEIKKEARVMAEKTLGYIPVIFSAEFLEGNGHILRNQINETSKSFATFSFLPELNHHLMEGLKNPPDKKLFILFISSNLYSDRLLQRVKLTKDVILKNNLSFGEYKLKGGDKLSSVLESLAFGGYFSLFMAELYREDPSLIPWVDYFKKELEKLSSGSLG